MCQVTITMRDGSRGVHIGRYRTTCEALIAALALFPEALCISARRVNCQQVLH